VISVSLAKAQRHREAQDTGEVARGGGPAGEYCLYGFQIGPARHRITYKGALASGRAACWWRQMPLGSAEGGDRTYRGWQPAALRAEAHGAWRFRRSAISQPQARPDATYRALVWVTA
jgi:hypothetical protein